MRQGSRTTARPIWAASPASRTSSAGPCQRHDRGATTPWAGRLLRPSFGAHRRSAGGRPAAGDRRLRSFDPDTILATTSTAGGTVRRRRRLIDPSSTTVTAGDPVGVPGESTSPRPRSAVGEVRTTGRRPRRPTAPPPATEYRGDGSADPEARTRSPSGADIDQSASTRRTIRVRLSGHTLGTDGYQMTGGGQPWPIRWQCSPDPQQDVVGVTTANAVAMTASARRKAGSGIFSNAPAVLVMAITHPGRLLACAGRERRLDDAAGRPQPRLFGPVPADPGRETALFGEAAVDVRRSPTMPSYVRDTVSPAVRREPQAGDRVGTPRPGDRRRRRRPGSGRDRPRTFLPKASRIGQRLSVREMAGGYPSTNSGSPPSAEIDMRGRLDPIDDRRPILCRGRGRRRCTSSPSGRRDPPEVVDRGPCRVDPHAGCPAAGGDERARRAGTRVVVGGTGPAVTGGALSSQATATSPRVVTAAPSGRGRSGGRHGCTPGRVRVSARTRRASCCSSRPPITSRRASPVISTRTACRHAASTGPPTVTSRAPQARRRPRRRRAGGVRRCTPRRAAAGAITSPGTVARQSESRR